MPRRDRKPSSDSVRGPNQRDSAPHSSGPAADEPIDPRDLGAIGHDDLGNAVWQWHPKVPGRLPEDPTLDYLEALEVDGLSIEDEEDGESGSEQAFSPYGKDS